VRQRQTELHEMKQFILHDPSFSPMLQALIDPSQVFAAGFSYGAATASLEVVTHPKDYAACILLDGWFHIEVGEGFDFPKEVHDTGTQQYVMSRLFCTSIVCVWFSWDLLIAFPFEIGISIPTLFIGSSQFADRPGLAKATENLAAYHHCKSTSHVLANSKHQNFVDVGFWLPPWLLRKVGAIGACDFDATYVELLMLTKEFLGSQLKSSIKKEWVLSYHYVLMYKIFINKFNNYNSTYNQTTFFFFILYKTCVN
jgi:hypothetical protein